MDSPTHEHLHLSGNPGTTGTFPECLRPEVERVARQIWKRHVAVSEASDAVHDWLEAEEEVIGRYFDSPARFLPGGDLFERV